MLNASALICPPCLPFDDHMFTARFGPFRAHRELYEHGNVLKCIKFNERGSIPCPAPCDMCILATGQNRDQLLDTSQAVIHEVPRTVTASHRPLCFCTQQEMYLEDIGEWEGWATVW